MTAADEKPGCLSSIFPFLKPKERRDDQHNQEVDQDEPGDLPYRLRDDFLSVAEFSFYKVLSSLLVGRFSIQTKVRLADVFFVANPNKNRTYFSRIAQKHLDFLVCDPTNMKPLFGIELDDSSHSRDDRKERDEFVKKACVAANFPLIHFPAQREYNTREIEAVIAPYINYSYPLQARPQPVIVSEPINVSPRVHSASTSSQPEIKPLLSSSPKNQQPTVNEKSASIPNCPKCGIPMTLRQATQGQNKGKFFYGCRNYPQCREMIIINS